MGDALGWNHPLILTIDPNFQRDIQVPPLQKETHLEGTHYPLPWLYTPEN